jgi:hypothetical protein
MERLHIVITLVQIPCNRRLRNVCRRIGNLPQATCSLRFAGRPRQKMLMISRPIERLYFLIRDHLAEPSNRTASPSSRCVRKGWSHFHDSKAGLIFLFSSIPVNLRVESISTCMSLPFRSSRARTFIEVFFMQGCSRFGKGSIIFASCKFDTGQIPAYTDDALNKREG